MSPAALTEIRRTQLAFWTAFARAADAASVSAPTPAAKNWCYLSIGTSRAKIVLGVSLRDQWVECKLALTPTRHASMQRDQREDLAALVAQRAMIERELGFCDLVWGDPTPTRIYRRQHIAVSEQPAWPQAFAWLIATATGFERVFGPRLTSRPIPVTPAPENRPKEPRETHRARTAPRPARRHQSSLSTSGDPTLSVGDATNLPVDTIEALFAALINDRGMTRRDGSFAARPGTSQQMPWTALYSSEASPVYRYAFGLWWGAPSLSNTVAWVMLNPATGDTDAKPRPILTACRHRSENWHHTGLIIVNLFAYRAGDPRALRKLTEAEAIGPDNNAVLSAITGACGQTIAAWGDHGILWERSTTVRRHLRDPRCLPKPVRPLSLKGQPFYPKGIRLDTEPVALPPGLNAAAAVSARRTDQLIPPHHEQEDRHADAPTNTSGGKAGPGRGRAVRWSSDRAMRASLATHSSPKQRRRATRARC